MFLRRSPESIVSSTSSVDINTRLLKPGTITQAMIAPARATPSTTTGSNPPRSPPLRTTKGCRGHSSVAEKLTNIDIQLPPITSIKDAPNHATQSTASLPVPSEYSPRVFPTTPAVVTTATAATSSSSKIPPFIKHEGNSITLDNSLASSHTSTVHTPIQLKHVFPVPKPPPPRPHRRRSLPAAAKLTHKDTLRKPNRSRTRSPSSLRSPRRVLRRINHHYEARKHQWRWHITLDEQKRYEALWAANRGLLLPACKRDFIVNLVVGEIWSRSRLGTRTLSEIWELVDRGAKGVLDQEEFCIGTWLVDQALRGRKVPVRIEQSVWDNVKNLGIVFDLNGLSIGNVLPIG